MIAALTLSVLTALSATPFDNAFNNAAQAYEAQQYPEAITQYESLVHEGVEDPVVFYNLGNAYYRGGQVAAAIANYERALHLDPRLEAARHNLELAVASTQGHLARPLPSGWQEAVLFWDDHLRTGEVRWLAIVSWAAFWAILLWRVVARRKYQLVLATVLLLVAAASMVSLYTKSHPLQLAVAQAAEVQVRIGNSAADTVRYTLSHGDRVKVEAESNGWLRVATASGERGWAPVEVFVRVGPPYQSPPSEESSGANAAENAP